MLLLRILYWWWDNYVNWWMSLVVLVGLLIMTWDVVQMMLLYYWSLFYVEIKRFTFIWFFGELFARIQGIGMSCYVCWTISEFISVLNIRMNLWYYNLLWCWDWWMNLWWCMILIWMIIACRHWWMTLHVSKHVSWGAMKTLNPVMEVVSGG